MCITATRHHRRQIAATSRRTPTHLSFGSAVARMQPLAAQSGVTWHNPRGLCNVNLMLGLAFPYCFCRSGFGLYSKMFGLWLGMADTMAFWYFCMVDHTIGLLFRPEFCMAGCYRVFRRLRMTSHTLGLLARRVWGMCLMAMWHDAQVCMMGLPMMGTQAVDRFMPHGMHRFGNMGMPVRMHMSDNMAVPVRTHRPDDMGMPVRMHMPDNMGMPVRMHRPDNMGMPVRMHRPDNMGMPVRTHMPDNMGVPVRMHMPDNMMGVPLRTHMPRHMMGPVTVPMMEDMARLVGMHMLVRYPVPRNMSVMVSVTVGPMVCSV